MNRKLKTIVIASVLCTLSILGIVVFYGCSNGNENLSIETNTVKTESLAFRETFDNFVDIIESVQIIPLSDSDDFLMGDILKANQVDSLFVIMYDANSNNTKEVGIFDSNGICLRKIGRQGNGPGEYHRIESMAVSNDTVIIYDGYDSSLRAYSITGEFLGTLNPDIDLLDVNDMYANNGLIVYRSNLNSYKPIIYAKSNTPGEEPESIYSHSYVMDTPGELTSMRPICMSSDSTLLLTLPLQDGIMEYNYYSNHMTTKYKFEPGLNYHPNDGDKVSEIKQTIGQQSLLTGIPLSVVSHRDWLIFNYLFGTIIWNKVRHNGFKTINGYNAEAVQAFPLDLTNIVAHDNRDWIFTSMSAEQFLKFRNRIDWSITTATDRTLIDELHIDSNPVIVKYRLKNTFD